jgi:hypothetical protein
MHLCALTADLAHKRPVTGFQFSRLPHAAAHEKVVGTCCFRRRNVAARGGAGGIASACSARDARRVIVFVVILRVLRRIVIFIVAVTAIANVVAVVVAVTDDIRFTVLSTVKVCERGGRSVRIAKRKGR